jgi:hypothetical protein
MEMYRKRKILLLILAACIVFSAVSAETLIAVEHDHICTGHYCHVCLQIEIVKCFLRTLNLAGIIFFIAVLRPFFTRAISVYNKFSYNIPTLIALKVRFNS